MNRQDAKSAKTKREFLARHRAFTVPQILFLSLSRLGALGVLAVHLVRGWQHSIMIVSDVGDGT
jgi:hypothetical protein